MWIMCISKWEYVFVSQNTVKLRIIGHGSVDKSVHMCITLWESMWKSQNIHDKIVNK